jgi:hypothetical protein
MRVIDWVHRDAAAVRLAIEPTAASGLANGDKLMLDVSDLTDCRRAFHQHHAAFAGWKADLRVKTFTRHQLH